MSPVRGYLHPSTEPAAVGLIALGGFVLVAGAALLAS